MPYRGNAQSRLRMRRARAGVIADKKIGQLATAGNRPPAEPVRPADSKAKDGSAPAKTGRR
jgi:hypothetical protein